MPTDNFNEMDNQKLKRGDKNRILSYLTVGLGVLLLIFVSLAVVNKVVNRADFLKEWLFDGFAYVSGVPRQDEQGYYLLKNKRDFEWFIVNEGYIRSEPINVRLAADIVLNDTTGWKNWDRVPPENAYVSIANYQGEFDGNGHALIGFFSRYEMPVFVYLEPGGVIRNLSLQKCMMVVSADGHFYENDNGRLQSMYAASLCYSNGGTITQCSADVVVTSQLESGGLVGGNLEDGIISDCQVTGTVIGGRDWARDWGKYELTNLECEGWDTGGICGVNLGMIINCVNEADVFMAAVNDDNVFSVAVGGICGTNSGTIINSENRGRIKSTQWAGGIAGSSYGTIERCKNSGSVHVEPVYIDHIPNLLVDGPSGIIAGGIVADNQKDISFCFNSGSVTIDPVIDQAALYLSSTVYANPYNEDENATSVDYIFLSNKTPIYAIACNVCDEARTINCYYLATAARQEYRQPGVYKLTAAEAEHLDDDLLTAAPVDESENPELRSAIPNDIGADRDDYTVLSLGPKQDTVYQVQPGDSLWRIAEKYYGHGEYYHLLVRTKKLHDKDWLRPGELITIPTGQYYLMHSDNEEGADFCVISEDERRPVRYLLVKPRDWDVESTDVDCNLHALRPQNDSSNSTILYYYCHNRKGDFFTDWEAVKTNLCASAAYYCGDQISGIRFYRYGIAANDSLYGYTFQIYRNDVTLDCAVYYRLKEGLSVEYIGITPAGEDPALADRVRYLAARVDVSLAVEENPRLKEEETLLGRDNWSYPSLHNPFAICMQYDLNEDDLARPLQGFTGLSAHAPND